MSITEDFHYTLVKGHRLVPFGRKYQMLVATSEAPKGYCWDGMTMVPMRYNSGLMRGVLVHDRIYNSRKGTVSYADKCLNAIWIEDGIPWISRWIILSVLLWMRPTALAYWNVTGSKLKLLPLAAVNFAAFPLMIGYLT